MNRRLVFCCLFFLWALCSDGQVVKSHVTQNLEWRCIGPHRGGRTVGAAGIPDRPNEFYIGVNNGGDWRTTDFGRTWVPIFDNQDTGSIGCLAISKSSPQTIYVGSGEGLQRPDLSIGNGVYRSDDGGRNWEKRGLSDGQQISGIAIDPNDPNLVYAAVLGHPYGGNDTRGLYRSFDGGISWGKILGPDQDTGASQITIDPLHSNILYCSLWAARQAPWENGRWQGGQSGLFKSIDGGENWLRIEGGLPGKEQGLGRIGIGVSESNSNRIYATVDARVGGGIYRSDDAGKTWVLKSSDNRLWTRGDDFAEIKVDPKDPDTVYCANTAAYKSVDGGASWVCWKGAPGGDDYHTIWLNPENPEIVLMASDQGATVTVNGGQTWSSWYNQPTAQFYHVSTDNQWPYWVYGGQQESGSVGISSRGNDGQITFREWHPVGVEEYGYVAVDPLDHNIVYGGKISKYDKRTGQVQDISPAPRRSGTYRFLRTAPVIFSPVDPHLLYFAGNVLFATTDGGKKWKTLSGDLSREVPSVPKSFWSDKPLAEPGRRGVIYSVAPSHFKTSTIWCGTDDGLVWRTTDSGKSWKNISPPALESWSKISQIDAGHFDDETAYVSVNRIRCDDLKPYIYATHDGGKTWKLVVNGLPDDPVNAVREDPKCPGLLYCATERMVHFSIDDGKNWNSLRANMPCTSVRDIVLHDDDLVIGTHGRSFWIMDNISQLREVAKFVGRTTTMFVPQLATRVTWNMNTDTPLPPEEPGGKNPPDGAIIDFWLPTGTKSVQLEILDESGLVVRRYSSEDQPAIIDPKSISLPTYWLRPSKVLQTKMGSQRWLWDMRFQPIGGNAGPSMAAIFGDTPFAARGPRVPPGVYTLRLTANGVVTEKKLNVRLDPRARMSNDDLELQTNVTVMSYYKLKEIETCSKQVTGWRDRLKTATSENPESVRMLNTSLAQIEGDLSKVRAQFENTMYQADSCDMAPTNATLEQFALALQELSLIQLKLKEISKLPVMKNDREVGGLLSR